MAQVTTHFKCRICNDILKTPPNSSIVDYTISMLSFYKDHDRCEQLEKKLLKGLSEPKEAVQKEEQESSVSKEDSE